MTRRRLTRAMLSVLAVVVALVWVFPVYWMVNSALLPNTVLQSFIPTFLPVGGSLSNVSGVLADESTALLDEFFAEQRRAGGGFEAQAWRSSHHESCCRRSAA